LEKHNLEGSGKNTLFVITSIGNFYTYVIVLKMSPVAVCFSLGNLILQKYKTGAFTFFIPFCVLIYACQLSVQLHFRL